jgi:hypothetical protein
MKPYNPIWLKDREWTQKNGVHDAEYGGIQAHAKNQRRQHQNSHADVLAYQLQGKTEVLDQWVHGVNGSCWRRALAPGGFAESDILLPSPWLSPMDKSRMFGGKIR